jgi:hypothetical protein
MVHYAVRPFINPEVLGLNPDRVLSTRVGVVAPQTVNILSRQSVIVMPQRGTVRN